MAFLGIFNIHVKIQHCLQYSDFKTLIFEFGNLRKLFINTQNVVD